MGWFDFFKPVEYRAFDDARFGYPEYRAPLQNTITTWTTTTTAVRKPFYYCSRPAKRWRR